MRRFVVLLALSTTTAMLSGAAFAAQKPRGVTATLSCDRSVGAQATVVPLTSVTGAVAGDSVVLQCTSDARRVKQFLPTNDVAGAVYVAWSVTDAGGTRTCWALVSLPDRISSECPVESGDATLAVR
jgi:hypothetical protein